MSHTDLIAEAERVRAQVEAAIYDYGQAEYIDRSAPECIDRLVSALRDAEKDRERLGELEQRIAEALYREWCGGQRIDPDFKHVNLAPWRLTASTLLRATGDDTP